MNDFNGGPFCFKRNSTLLESAPDDSGYTSFDGAHPLHSSTNSPLLIGETNVESQKTKLNTVKRNRVHLQTPYSNVGTTNLLRQQNSAQPTIEEHDQSSLLNESKYISPLPPEQLHSATKRRKADYQHHSSPKKSKKKLCFPSDETDDSTTSQRRFYNGVEHLDIISMLENYPILETILNQLNTRTLVTMTQVSQRWHQILYKSRRTADRLQQFHIKMNLSKENVHHVTMMAIKNKSQHHHNNNNTLPLQNVNRAYLTRQYSQFSMEDTSSSSLLPMQPTHRRVKCPRCGRASNVYENISLNSMSQPKQRLHTTYSIDSALHVERRPQLSSFQSFDQVQDTNESTQEYGYAMCIGTACNFRFCLNCFSQYHPGKKCPITELGTPSKIVLPLENSTPPKRIHKQDPKLKRKSLKRLCF